MRAVEGSRYFKERTRLETVIPLRTPYVLFADPSSACNIKCGFCPCGSAHADLWSETRRKSVGIMDLKIFQKIVKDCKAFPDKIKALRLYKEGEPLLNPHFAEMVAFAKESGCFLGIDTTTNGTLLNPALNREIIRAGLTRINISVVGLDDDAYERLCGVRIDFEQFRENIRDLYEHKGDCHIFIKTVAEEGIHPGQSDDGKKEQRFKDLFGDICDEISFEHPSLCWPGFDLETEQSEVGTYGNPMRQCIVCPYLFYGMPINSDGTASICFADWNRKVTLGNVQEDAVPKLWNRMDSYRIAHLKGNRKQLPGCNECQQPNLTAVDNIDSFREELLAKMTETEAGQ